MLYVRLYVVDVDAQNYRADEACVGEFCAAASSLISRRGRSAHSSGQDAELFPTASKAHHYQRTRMQSRTRNVSLKPERGSTSTC